MGWSEEEEPLFVLEDGTVLIYSMFGIFKTSFSMGQEAKDIKILGARYNSSNFLNCNWKKLKNRSYLNKPDKNFLLILQVNEKIYLHFYNCKKFVGKFVTVCYRFQSQVCLEKTKVKMMNYLIWRQTETVGSGYIHPYLYSWKKLWIQN